MKRLLVIIALTQCGLFGCRTPPEKNTTGHNEQAEVYLSGKELSLKYCQSCHLYPEPSRLDKHTWERSVLPLMGRLFGIYEKEVPRSEILKGAIDKSLVERLNIFPEKQVIDDKTWRMIADYYISTAPQTLSPAKTRDKPFTAVSRFEVIHPDFKSESAPATTFLKIDRLTSDVYLGEAKGKAGALTVLNKHLKVIQTIKLPAPPVDIDLNRNHLDITLVGSLVLAPSNNSLGRLLRILRDPGQEQYSSYRNFMDGLKRPLQTVFDDLNEDGHEDILIAEFGYYTGSLTLYESVGPKGSLKKKTLKDLPGAIKSSVKDMNGDGHKDIVTLFAQGDEGISIFYNNGNGIFREERVLRFSPSNGSVYFELVDFNNDGHPDILYCNGDNGDYPPVLKDYHGIHIFQNAGNNSFMPVYFFAMNGAFKSSAADFDNDGDLDIVGISHFPDFNANPRQDFVYLENVGHYSFSTHYLQGDFPGRWISFDIGDMNGDGFDDVLLGAFGRYNNRNKQRHQTAPLAASSLLYLRNIGR